MESSNEMVEDDDSCYPFADLSRLRTDAGAFMKQVLSEDDEDDEMEDEKQHVVTPDYQMFASSVAPVPPQRESHRRPVGLEPLTVLPQKQPGNSQDNPSIWNPFGARQTNTTPTPHTSLVEASNHHTLNLSHSIIPMTSTKANSVPTMTRQRSSPVKRSRSIQIKRNRRGSQDEIASSSVSASAEQMYDWATWRMYHRITTARRNKSSVTPLPDGNTSASYQDTVSNSRTYRGLSGFPKDGGDPARVDSEASPQKGSPTATSQEKNDFEEGVFVMDL